MDKDFAEKLVENHRLAAMDCARQLDLRDKRTAAENLAQAEDDLLQALRVPKQVEEDYPTVKDLAAIAALKGFCTNRGPVESHYGNNAFAAFEQAAEFMAERARRQGGDHA